MFGVIYYTVAGRYENGVYKKVSLMNIVVKFRNFSQYSNCDFSMNSMLKPYIDEHINSKSFVFDTQVNERIDKKWAVDDVIARRSFFVWTDERNSMLHIDVTKVKFPKQTHHWVINDSMFSSFVREYYSYSRSNRVQHTNTKKRKLETSFLKNNEQD